LKTTVEDSPLFEAYDLLQEAIMTDLKPSYILLRAFQHCFVNDFEEALKDFKFCLQLDQENSEA